MFIGNGASVGAIISAGDVWVGHGTTVASVVRTPGVVHPEADSVLLVPPEKTPVQAAGFAEFDISLPNTSSAPDLLVYAGQKPVTVNQGVYRQLHVYSGTSATLHAGTYFVDSLTLEPNALLNLDTTMGSVVLHVVGDVTIRGMVVGGEKLLVIHHGTGQVLVESSLSVTLISPHGRIILRTQGSPVTGNFFARNIDVDPDVEIRTPSVAVGDPGGMQLPSAP